MYPLFFGTLGIPELLAIGFIIAVIFGIGKIPLFLDGLGKGIHNFKKGIRIGGSIDDDEKGGDDE